MTAAWSCYPTSILELREEGEFRTPPGSDPKNSVGGLRTLVVVILVCFSWAALADAQVSVLTYHNDNSRTGQNTAETTLTPSNVNASQFGKLFSRTVDGYVYAQPLYLPNVTFPALGTHNVLYVATEHDSVYAWDADSNAGSNALPLWKVSFINPSAKVYTVNSIRDVGCTDLVPEIGITGTPVIDSGTGTLYVVAATKENGSFVQRLHALDVTSGAEKFGGPVVIQASVPGSGDGSSGGMVSFDPLLENQRPGLLLQNGVMYIGWGSHCDFSPYHGWVIAYNASTLQQLGVFNTTPNGGLGGFWQAGSAPAADASNNVYLATGNGTFDAVYGGVDFGDSIIKLALGSGNLSLLDYFTPSDEGFLFAFDVDLGSGGVLLLPDEPGTYPHLLVQAGKEGAIYLVNRDKMGGFNRVNNSQIVQYLPSAVGGMWSMPAYWNSYVYFWGAGDVLKAYTLSGGLLSNTPVGRGNRNVGFPGSTPSVSASGNANGIVWAIESDQYAAGGPGVLRAYDATDLFELYNSSNNGTRDLPGGAVKFTVPTVANGKVYVGAVRQVSVYGLLH